MSHAILAIDLGRDKSVVPPDRRVSGQLGAGVGQPAASVLGDRPWDDELEQVVRAAGLATDARHLEPAERLAGVVECRQK